LSSFSFDLSPNPAANRKEQDAPWRVLLLADLSGRASRTNSDESSIADRPLRRVDFDRFESLFVKTSPRLSLPLPDGSLDVTFSSMEDFHPDEVFDRLDVFAAFRDLRQRLGDPQRFAAAAEELKAAGLGGKENTAKGPEASNTEPNPSETKPTDESATDFNRLLGGNVEMDSQTDSPGRNVRGTIDAYIHQLVAPHITPEMVDQPAYLSILDNALEEGMRGLLHHPDWQRLEATWRSIEAWIQDDNLDETVELSVLDITSGELEAELRSPDLDNSGLHRQLAAAATGGRGFDLVLADFTFGQTTEELITLATLGALGARVGAPILAASSPLLLGSSRFSEAVNEPNLPADEDLAEVWSAVRQNPVAPWIGLVAPRLLLRLPYGKQSDPIDRFAFEERPPTDSFETYLWGTGVLDLGRTFLAGCLGTGTGSLIEGVPAATFRDGDGEVQMLPPAEVYLSERVKNAWVAAGVCPLVSEKGRDRVHVPRIQSIADPPTRLQGRGTQ